MIEQDRLRLIRQKHGLYASWAIWANQMNDRPKSGIGDLTIFESPGLCGQLHPSIVLVGLNFSRIGPATCFGNFHDPKPQAMDFKLRHALRGTTLWGGYMTDIIKNFEEKVSGKMMAHLRNNPEFERQNVAIFEEELKDLGAEAPTLVALGADSFKILERNFRDKYQIWRLPHYSNYCSQEVYREQVVAAIGAESRSPSPDSGTR